MAANFTILRGKKETLIDNNGVCLIPDKLVNGYWYLTDTAEVYVALPDSNNTLQLKKINDCDINNDFDFDSFEDRLSTLEEQEKIHTYGYRNGFPVSGEEGHMYVAVDEEKTYVWYNNTYVIVGCNSEDPQIIFGGSAL